MTRAGQILEEIKRLEDELSYLGSRTENFTPFSVGQEVVFLRNVTGRQIWVRGFVRSIRPYVNSFGHKAGEIEIAPVKRDGRIGRPVNRIWHEGFDLEDEIEDSHELFAGELILDRDTWESHASALIKKISSRRT